jgi:hypothetical protein
MITKFMDGKGESKASSTSSGSVPENRNAHMSDFEYQLSDVILVKVVKTGNGQRTCLADINFFHL